MRRSHDDQKLPGWVNNETARLGQQRDCPAGSITKLPGWVNNEIARLGQQRDCPAGSTTRLPGWVNNETAELDVADICFTELEGLGHGTQ